MARDASSDRSTERRREYVVVARRYRPKSFEELVGQNQVSRALAAAIHTNRVGHAYLFTGARGVGKTSTARIFAKALNCVQGPTDQPCNTCDICMSVAAGDDVDVLEIDGASNRGIDEIRQLRSNVNIRPSRARFKIYIIDEVHMLTLAAFNALLKTLEEPPEHVKFIFCTTDADKIPITILSRCQRFDFPPVEASAIVDRLRFIVQQEGMEADDEALQILARRANGSLRDSQSLLEQLLSHGQQRIGVADVHAMLGTARGGQLAALMAHVADHDVAGALRELDTAIRAGVDAGQLAEQLIGYFRDMMAALVGCGPDLMIHTTPSDQPHLLEIAQRIGLETLLAMVQVLDQALSRMRFSPQVRTLLEISVVRICKLDRLDELSDILAQLRQPAQGVASGSDRGARSPAASGADQERTSQEKNAPEKKTTRRPGVGSVAEADERARTSGAGPSAADGEMLGVRDVSDASAPARAGALLPERTAAPEGRAVPGDRLAPGEQAAAGEVAGGILGSDAGVMSQEAISAMWKEALATMGDMTSDFARHAERVTCVGANRLVASFGPGYILHKESCERPDRRTRLENALSQVSGRLWRVDFEILPGELPPEARPQPVLSARQKLREKEKNALVKRAIEMFDAEVVRVEEPRGG